MQYTYIRSPPPPCRPPPIITDLNSSLQQDADNPLLSSTSLSHFPFFPFLPLPIYTPFNFNTTLPLPVLIPCQPCDLPASFLSPHLQHHTLHPGLPTPANPALNILPSILPTHLPPSNPFFPHLAVLLCQRCHFNSFLPCFLLTFHLQPPPPPLPTLPSSSSANPSTYSPSFPLTFHLQPFSSRN